ncbi:MAG: glycosyltransferase family 2 protein [Clostridium sp.]|uniref:glycosyltransferase family 2 protein n=1 Tax=Clostridium sp. TaxID=1506 RepID=UPI003F375067
MEQEKILVSIIVPIYNVESYLQKCIESIIEYKERNIEILLVNDGSTDRSKEICETYERLDTRIKLINKVNGGLSDARNFGIINACGEYLMFLDSDDFVDDMILKTVIDHIKESKVDVIMSPYKEIVNDEFIKINGENSLLENCSECVVTDEILKKIFEKTTSLWPAWRYIVKKNFLEENKILFKKGFLHEDIDFTTKILLKMKSFKYVNIAWYCYRVNRDGSIMNNRGIRSLMDIMNIIIDLKREMENEMGVNKVISELVLRRLSKTFYTTIRLFKLASRKEKKEIIAKLQKNKYILDKSNKLKHRIVFNLGNIIGIERMIKIINKIG